MRTLYHIVIGTVAGFALGILAPIAMALAMTWIDPVGMQQGGGTPFAIMIIATAPLGAFAGAIWGYQCAHPSGTIIKGGPHRTIDAFAEEVANYPIDEQRSALSLALPVWLSDFRQWSKTRLIVAGLLTVLIITGGRFLWIVLLLYLLRMAVVVTGMRSAIETIRARWGNDIVDQQGELPFLLRTRERNATQL
jgi:hypothetical protein